MGTGGSEGIECRDIQELIRSYVRLIKDIENIRGYEYKVSR